MRARFALSLLTEGKPRSSRAFQAQTKNGPVPKSGDLFGLVEVAVEVGLSSGVSPDVALALEEIGWGSAEHWMRMQAGYGLAQARRERDSGNEMADSRLA